MLKKTTHIKILMLLCLLVSGVITACNNDDEDPSNMIQLKSFGPSPALRGGELKFIGTNLDEVTSIVLPGNVEITSFKTKSSELIVIEVPEETVEGVVVLRTPDGDIESKTILGISEPITIASITPEKVRPGDKVTIKGTYLNLIKEVIFSNKKIVTEFESQSKTTLEVIVPNTAQTGAVVLSDGEEIPILVESESELEVVLPNATSLSPNPVKAGADLTIKGTDLDLATAVVFVGGSRVEKEDFELTDGGDIIITVPSNAQDGKIKLVAPSLVEAESSEELTMVAPTITAILPIPAKTGSTITVTGENLDLVTSVSFNGQAEEGEDGEVTIAQTTGEILDGGTATEITVKIPADATEGIVNFHTGADHSVASTDVLTLAAPIITSFTPTTVNTVDNPSITITGNNLDIVAKVVFGGDWEAEVLSASENSITIDIPSGSLSGPFTLVATNGTEVVSDDPLTIVPNVPHVTNMPAEIFVGKMLTIEGTNMDVFTNIIFPGGVKATTFGLKSATKIEVMVPEDTKTGAGKIKFVTNGRETVESPEINIMGAISYYIYNDALSADWQQWGGWGTSVQDAANTEQVKSGSSAIKVGYNSDGWGAFQLHPVDPAAAFDGYTTFVISVYGGAGSDGQSMAISGKNAAQVEFAGTTITVVEGQYTTFEIPFTDLGSPEGIYELWIKNNSTAGYTIYIDEIGLR